MPLLLFSPKVPPYFRLIPAGTVNIDLHFGVTMAGNSFNCNSLITGWITHWLIGLVVIYPTVDGIAMIIGRKFNHIRLFWENLTENVRDMFESNWTNLDFQSVHGRGSGFGSNSHDWHGIPV